MPFNKRGGIFFSVAEFYGRVISKRVGNTGSGRRVEHRGEALPGLDTLGLYEGEEGGMVEHRGEASLRQVHKVFDQV